MKSQVLYAVWCNISGEFAGEIWNWSLLGVKGLKTTFSQSFIKRNVKVRFGSIITFHLSKLSKARFSTLCDVIFLDRLQGKFEIDHFIFLKWFQSNVEKSYLSIRGSTAVPVRFQAKLVQEWDYGEEKSCRGGGGREPVAFSPLPLRRFSAPQSYSQANFSWKRTGTRGHRGNTYITSLPLVSIRRLGHVNSVSVEMKFHL